MKNKSLAAAGKTYLPLLAVLLASSSAVHAQSAGDFVVSSGWLHLSPNDSSEPMKVSALGQQRTIPGSGASVSNADTLGVTATYYVTAHAAIQTILGVPTRLNLYGSGTMSDMGKLGDAKAWSPALLFQYYFGESNARIRPYVGVGGAYVWFSDIKLTSGTASGSFLHSPVTGSALEGPTSVTLSKSFAPLANAGIAYNLDDRWSVNLSLTYALLSSRATLTTQSRVGVVTSGAKIKINPLVSFLSIGYRF
jgi:outer membrane protein